MGHYQKAEIRKPEILENYYQVLLEEGFEGTSIGKIARRMDIHPSLIIHYFKNKENMKHSKLTWHTYEELEQFRKEDVLVPNLCEALPKLKVYFYCKYK